MTAGNAVYSELKNLVVWAKSNAGMGSFYRSQHELIFVWKSGTAPHLDNFKLGQYGRPVARQNSSMAHMWVADPNKPGFISKIFGTHPPIPDRIARLEKIGGTF